MINVIVCVDNNFGIGKNNNLLYHLKGDMKFFKETTTGHVVAMGWNTYLSLGSKPLKNRTNLVLAPEGCDADGCVTVHSFEAMLNIIQKYAYREEAEVFVIGGAMFYASMLPYVDRIYLTKVDAVDPEAQAFFPNIDKNNNFKVKAESEVFTEGELNFKFIEYIRRGN